MLFPLSRAPDSLSRAIRIPLAWLCLALTASMARSAEAPANPPGGDAGWIVTLGLMPAMVTFPGSHESGSAYPLPWFSVRRPGEAAEFFSPDDGLDFTLFSSGGFSAGPVADLRSGRRPGGGLSALGFRNVPATVDAGVYAEYWTVPDFLRSRLELRQAVNGAGLGARLDIGLDFVRRVGKTTISGGPRAALGDRSYMLSYFGTSTTPPPPAVPYRPGAGPRSLGGILAVNHALDDTLSILAFARLDRLVGGAEHSPATGVSRARWELLTGVGVAWSFAWKPSAP